MYTLWFEHMEITYFYFFYDSIIPLITNLLFAPPLFSSQLFFASSFLLVSIFSASVKQKILNLNFVAFFLHFSNLLRVWKWSLNRISTNFTQFSCSKKSFSFDSNANRCIPFYSSRFYHTSLKFPGCTCSGEHFQEAVQREQLSRQGCGNDGYASLCLCLCAHANVSVRGIGK